MPLIIYIFALCVFAIGFTEFITIGLLSTIATSLHTDITQAGLTVTLYAAGVVISASLFTALMSRFPRKKTLLFALVIFTFGNILGGCSTHLSVLVIARIISGIGHGLFIAIAASVTKQLVSPQHIGKALSLIFGGISVAMSLGIPLSTWLSHLLPWQYIFFLIALCSALGTIGVFIFMPAIANDNASISIWKNVSTIGNKYLLAGASITALTFTGSFVLYAFISPILEQITHIDIQQSSIFMLIYGLGAIVGNVLGGKLTDRFGIEKATLCFIYLITIALIWIGFFSAYAIPMFIGCALLGCFTYGIIPPVQARMLNLAMEHAPDALDIASGMNVSAFNVGIMLGSGFGMLTITYGELSYLAWVGTLCCILASIYFVIQTRTTSRL